MNHGSLSAAVQGWSYVITSPAVTFVSGSGLLLNQGQASIPYPGEYHVTISMQVTCALRMRLLLETDEGEVALQDEGTSNG